MNNLQIIGISVAGLLLAGVLLFKTKSVNEKNNTIRRSNNTISRSNYTKYQQDMHEKRTREFEKNLFKSFRTQRKTESSNKLGGTRRKFK
jgi:hypothetical protein